MSQMILHKANTRGHANHGWLDSFHSFSFANYYNAERMHFGVLRVLNDDSVDGGMGFGNHPHENMEIITIPLEGELRHKDSMGNSEVIKAGEIQVMSAGTGIQHSEFNNHSHVPVKFLQIWIFPNQNNVAPRYDQMTLDTNARHNKLQQILSPYPNDEGVWIYQNAWFHMTELDKGHDVEYTLKLQGNGVYIFVIKGEVVANGQLLNTRDGLGIWEIESVQLRADSDHTQVLLMEVPMDM